MSEGTHFFLITSFGCLQILERVVENGQLTFISERTHFGYLVYSSMEASRFTILLPTETGWGAAKTAVSMTERDMRMLKRILG